MYIQAHTPGVEAVAGTGLDRGSLGRPWCGRSEGVGVVKRLGGCGRTWGERRGEDV